jgi:hypothetical protein
MIGEGVWWKVLRSSGMWWEVMRGDGMWGRCSDVV